MPPMVSRIDIAANVLKAERTWKADPKSAAASYAYASALFQSSDFWRAWEIIQPQAEVAKATADTTMLAGRVASMLGHYDLAEKYLRKLLGDKAHGVAAQSELLLAYYQRDRFDAIRAMPAFPAGAQPPPPLATAQAFSEPPYQLEWASQAKISNVRLLSVDPLPTFMIEVNGLPLAVMFDSGADMLILDTEVARAMGIKNLSSAAGTFGGGRKAEVGAGKVDSIKVGDVTLKQVPVGILPVKKFSPLFYEAHGVVLGGVIGTALLRQFVATLDYRNERLILRERTASSVAAVRKSLTGKIAAEVPFALAGTHFMLARGSINGKGVNWFVDSGLGSGADKRAFAVPLQTLNYLGMAEPGRKMDPNSVGGGGGAWASATIKADTIALGTLLQKGRNGDYGSFAPPLHFVQGYLIDGILSHEFLRQYGSWTIDFDAMTNIFGR